MRRLCRRSNAPALMPQSGLHPQHQLREHLCDPNEQPVRVAMRGGHQHAAGEENVQRGRTFHGAAASDQVELRLAGAGPVPVPSAMFSKIEELARSIWSRRLE